MKRMNWGWGIITFYAGFVAFMLCMVWLASAQKVEMVTTDYYKKELVYQQHINKANNARALEQPVMWKVEGETVQIKFPVSVLEGPVSGSILFYRPGDSSKDVTVQLNVGANGICIVKPQLVLGVYRLQMDWKAGEKEYYNEGVINIK